MNRKQKERIEKEKLRDEENSKQTQPKIDAGKYLFILLQTEKNIKQQSGKKSLANYIP